MGPFAWLRKRVKTRWGTRLKSVLIELFRSSKTLCEEGRWAEALSVAERALDLARSHVGKAHPYYARSLSSLANVHAEMGDHAAALPLYQRAADVLRGALGEADPSYARSLSSLANVHAEMGDHAAALPLFRQALEINRAALGEHHPIIPELLARLAELQAASDRFAEALNLMIQAAVIEDRVIGQFLSSGSESQRIAFLSGIRWNMYRIITLALGEHGAHRAATETALDLVLRRKAVLAEALALQRDAVSRYVSRRRAHGMLSDTDLVAWERKLAALRSRIAQETLAGPGSEGIESHRRLLDRLEAERQQMEAERAGEIAAMVLAQELRIADRRSVALSLPSDVALVEFVRFQPRDFRAVLSRAEPAYKPARYVAFVVHARAPDDVQVVDLGEADPIDHLIADYRGGLLAGPEERSSRDLVKTHVGPAQDSPADVGSALRAAVFDVLTSKLGGCAKLMLAPDGDLARLPFETLPCGPGRWLIDVYRISYLSCGRDVLRFGAASPCRPGKPLVIADPDFDLKDFRGWLSSIRRSWPSPLRHDNDTTAAKLTGVPPRELANPTPGRRSRDLARQSYHFEHLPGTRAEGEVVSRLLCVRAWMGAAALEGRLKAGCRSPRILHLATHGFFLPDQLHGAAREGGGLRNQLAGDSGPLSGPPPENPMLRSGLALAGANTWLESNTPPSKAEDGLLTAEEVTGLDLLATELVVLSACETGLGKIHVGEGVFGLRRAFVLAGARTLVMSLWKVPDEPTRELMEDFYGRLLAGEGRAEALRQAQLEMKQIYPDPFYWGAFICQGDPSPLGTVRPEIAGTGVAADLPTGFRMTPDMG
jgi:CHAT domain-containing protein/tetratricopeptide (TPR) repeat protein